MVVVDFSILPAREPLTLADISLHFTSTIEPHGHVYKSAAGDEAIVTYNQETGAVFGTLKTVTGDSFALEKCSLGFAWKEFSVDSFEADTAVLLDLPEDSTTGVLQAKAAADNVTAASYSVMFYYTPEFADITADIDGFIDQVLAETNQAYVQSGVPLIATKFCTERATIHDASGTGSSQLISAFRGMKASVAELRNTADSAVLLATDFSSCGVAYLNTIGSGNTISGKIWKKNVPETWELRASFAPVQFARRTAALATTASATSSDTTWGSLITRRWPGLMMPFHTLGCL